MDVHGASAASARVGLGPTRRAGTHPVSAKEYSFSGMAVIGALPALEVVTALNVVHAALYLVVTLLSVGAVYLLLQAAFVAWVQILIYVGAIVILFLFGLMLTKAPIGRDTLDHLPQNRVIGAVVALLVFSGGAGGGG